MPTTSEFHNDASQAERREVIENDRKVHDTYFERAKAEVGNELGGRFKHLGAKVTAVPVYPRQPADSPWSQGHLVQKEEPFGVDINRVPEL